VGLIVNHMTEERINTYSLFERSIAILNAIKDKLPELIGHRLAKTLEVIAEVPAEEEELAKKLLDEAPQILQAYQCKSADCVKALSFVPDATVVRLISSMPEEFLDGRLFDLPYSAINFQSEDVNSRLRKASLEKIVSYVKDASILMQGGRTLSKHELIRNSNTLSILESRMVS